MNDSRHFSGRVRSWFANSLANKDLDNAQERIMKALINLSVTFLTLVATGGMARATDQAPYLVKKC